MTSLSRISGLSAAALVLTLIPPRTEDVRTKVAGINPDLAWLSLSAL